MYNLLKRSFFFTLLLAGLLSACTPPLQPQITSSMIADKLTEIIQRGILIVASDTAYPPQSELLPGVARREDSACGPTDYTLNQMAGFDIEVTREIAQRLGVEPCFVVPKWTQIIAGNWADRWDISIGSMAITTERMNNLYFTRPYTSGEAILFVHLDNHSYTQPADLSGKKVGACTGCAYEYYLRGTLEIPGRRIEYLIRDASIVGYDTDTSAIEDLALGDGLRLDAVLTDPDTGYTAIENGLPIKSLGEPVYYDYVAAAVDKESGKDPIPFVLEVSRIIQEMHSDGTLSRLSFLFYGDDFTQVAREITLDDLGQIQSPQE